MVVAPSNRIVGPRDPAVAALREILARAGIRESCTAEQEGIFFAFEARDEVSLHYNIPEEVRLSSGTASSAKAKGDMFRCCSVLAERGFAVTLVVSLRTLALFVRSEAESKTTDNR